MATKQDPPTKWLGTNRFNWQMVCDLLASGRYEHVARLLGAAQITGEQVDNELLDDLLVGAYQLCLACRQSVTETEWHLQASQESRRREQELRQTLDAILNVVEVFVTGANLNLDIEPEAVSKIIPDLIERDLNGVREPSGLWQRIQNLLGWRGPPQSSDRKISPTSATPAGQEAKAHLRSVIQLGGQPEQKQSSTASLVIYCLGPFRVYQYDQLVAEWNSLKGQSILKYLIMHKGKPIAKDILMDVFWPDVETGDTRRNLHQAIYSLRQTLRRNQPDLQPIQFKEDCYLLNPEISIWLDFEEFEKHIQTGRRLETVGQLAEAMAEYSIAEGLYQGDFLEEDLYEDWPSLQREQLRNLYLNIADRLTEHYLQQGGYTAAIGLCQKILDRDNCREEAYRRLMQCYLGQGQRHLAIRQYQTCVQALKKELDLTPSEETVVLYQHISTG